MLFDAVTERLQHHGGGARLGKEPKDIAFVDGSDGGFHIRLTSKQHPHGSRRDPANIGQKSDTVHARHALVGDYNGVRLDRSKVFEGHCGVGSRLNPVVAAQTASEPVQ